MMTQTSSPESAIGAGEPFFWGRSTSPSRRNNHGAGTTTALASRATASVAATTATAATPAWSKT